MHDVDSALSQISAIRAQMAASTRFRGFAPHAVAVTALVAVAVATAQTLWPEALAGDPQRYVAVWAGAAVAAIAIVAAETLARSRRLHGAMADAMIGSTLRLFLPYAAAGALIAFTICTVAPASAWTLPGLWQILVALAGFAAVGNLPRPIVWAASWYLLCGTAMLTIGGREASLSPWMMGAPFGLGQLLVAAILHFSAVDRDG